MSFFTELRRRNVFRVAIAYIVMAWLVMQVADVILNNVEAPGWVFVVLMLFLAVGFAFALIFAWAYELTPEGIKKEKDVDRAQSITHVTGRKLDYLIIAVLVIALGYFAFDKFQLSGTRVEAVAEKAGQTATEQALQQPAAKLDKSIAVLPFVDMSPDKDQEYFTDGLTENLLNALAQLSELKVAGRTSSFVFKNRNEDLRSIGKQLGVAHLLEGSVQKSGQRVRITAQLVNAGDGYHLWSQTYDRTLEDIFAVQDEIAMEVAKAMEITLLGKTANPQVRVSPNTGEAYNDYLKGLYESNLGTMESNRRAIEYFERALQKDSGLALAWAGLSWAQAFVTGFEDTDFTAGYEEARASALHALEIDPDLPEGHMALARIQTDFDWDWAAAEGSLNRALALRPGDTKIRRGLALLISTRGNYDGAILELQKVVEQDPLDWLSQFLLALGLTERGDTGQALPIFKHLVELGPERPGLYWGLGNLWLIERDYPQALEEFTQEKLDYLKLTGLAITHHYLQQREQAVASLQTLISAMGESSSYQIAEVYAQWGDADNAMSWLERGYNIRDPGLAQSGIDHLLDPIRDDPRFKAFLQKMNLADQ